MCSSWFRVFSKHILRSSFLYLRLSWYHRDVYVCLVCVWPILIRHVCRSQSCVSLRIVYRDPTSWLFRLFTRFFRRQSSNSHQNGARTIHDRHSPDVTVETFGCIYVCVDIMFFKGKVRLTFLISQATKGFVSVTAQNVWFQRLNRAQWSTAHLVAHSKLQSTEKNMITWIDTRPRLWHTVFPSRGMQEKKASRITNLWT